MTLHKLMTTIVSIFGLGAMGFGAYGMFSEDFPSAAKIWGTAAVRLSAAADVRDVRDAGVELIESPRECRHEIGIRDACTHL